MFFPLIYQSMMPARYYHVRVILVFPYQLKYHTKMILWHFGEEIPLFIVSKPKLSIMSAWNIVSHLCPVMYILQVGPFFLPMIFFMHLDSCSEPEMAHHTYKAQPKPKNPGLEFCNFLPIWGQFMPKNGKFKSKYLSMSMWYYHIYVKVSHLSHSRDLSLIVTDISNIHRLWRGDVRIMIRIITLYGVRGQELG